MKINDLFFSNVPTYGDLYLDAILLEDVYIVVSILKNKKGKYFICICCEVRTEQRWIISPISKIEVQEFLTNKVPAKMFFKQGEKIMVVRNYETKTESFSLLMANEIDENYLPSDDSYLDAEPGEWDEYLESISKCILKNDETSTSLLSLKSILLDEIVEHDKSQEDSQYRCEEILLSCA